MFLTTSQLLSAPLSSLLANLGQSVLVLAAAAEPALALAKPPPDCAAAGDPQGLPPCPAPPAPWLALPSWVSHALSQPFTLLLLGLLALLLLLFISLPSVTPRRNRHRKTPSFPTNPQRPRHLLPAMALFTLTTLALLAGLSLRSGSPVPSPTPVSFTPTTPAQTTPVFTIPATADIGRAILPNIHDPSAVDAQTACPGYRAANVRTTARGGWTAELRLAGERCDVYGNDVEELVVEVEGLARDRVRVGIRPRWVGKGNETWFGLPEEIVGRPKGEEEWDGEEGEMEVVWGNEPSFWFGVVRRVTGDVVFSTEGRVLVFEDQFVEFGTGMPGGYNLYGLGETMHGFRLGENLTRTLFAADVNDREDANLYGAHPVYLDTRYYTTNTPADGSGGPQVLQYAPDPTDTTKEYVSYTHGVFLRNAHAQEVLLRPGGITWRTLGGSIDLYLFSGPTAKEVMAEYQKTTVGLPARQQYWTLGFHQCRWGYRNWGELQEVVDGFEGAGIPLETIWSDIDYMKGYRDFENDPVRFGYAEGADFLARLHARHKHWVPIVDSAIYAPNPDDPADAYPPYDRGIEADAFMLNPDGSVYYGAVWPGYTVFPDWVGAVLNGTGAIDWWVDELSRWFKKVAFDGIWIDMSEVASFCVGSCGTGNLSLNPAHPPFSLPGEPGNLILTYPEGFELTNASEASSASSALHTQTSSSPPPPPPTPVSYHRTTPTPGTRNINWPPYAINNFHGDLAVHAISPNATHHGGAVQYDTHNLFGHQILAATHAALRAIHPRKRPFIIGRSTFPGSGRYAGHWGGDNDSRWGHLRLSLPQALSMALAGLPMFGVDVCGFGGNSDAELCARWMGAGAFFPFYRNHNILGARAQEPYLWGVVAEASKRAMRERYRLLPYLYTLMERAAAHGETVMRAVVWEFEGEGWLREEEGEFMLGGGLLVVPCLEQGVEVVRAVFPG
ncbi:exo-beta-1,3-glucanase, partial [Staphylotrichum tortipilum]